MTTYAVPGTNTPVQLLQPGIPSYFYGSFNARTPTTLMQITAVAADGATATVTVLVREGNIPAVGSLITIHGTATSGGAFNVTNASITAVSITAATSIGTVQFALAQTVGTTPDAGQAYVPVPEVGDTLANGTSAAFALQETSGPNTNSRVIVWSTVVTGAPASCTFTLQSSQFDIDSQYLTLDTSTSTTGETRSLADRNYRFLRVVVSNVAGGSSPKAIIKVAI